MGTWIGSIITHLWVYEGQLDAAGKVLILNLEGPDMVAEGKMVKSRDVIEWKSENHRVLTSRMLARTGSGAKSWQQTTGGRNSPAER